MSTWWEKYPERLEYELDALDAAGIEWDRDEEYLKLKIIAAFLPPLPKGASRGPLQSA